MTTYKGQRPTEGFGSAGKSLSGEFTFKGLDMEGMKLQLNNLNTFSEPTPSADLNINWVTTSTAPGPK